MESNGKECRLCPRKCGVHREAGESGICGTDSTVRIARAALHMWEEPCISGEKGSGAIFFSGCPLHCVFCQNRKISSGAGIAITVDELSMKMLELERQGAANINLVTPTHFAPQIIVAVRKAKEQGLSLPIVYNTSAYETVDTLQSLEGIVDIYLPDFKYVSPELAKKYSHAEDYPEIARESIAEMVRQTGEAVFDAEGYMVSGVVVRHLCIPGEGRDSKAVLEYLYQTYGNRIYISIMNQYTPPKEALPWANLNRKLSARAYDRIVDYAVSLGIENGFIQEGDTAEESFIPEFDVEVKNT